MKGFDHRGKFKTIQVDNGEKEADVGAEFDLVNCTTKKIS
jgi:hypothetical protein